MNIELPNGQILENVPSGLGKHGVATLAIQKGLAKPEDFGYEGPGSAASDSSLENFAAGTTAGVKSVGRKTANLLLPEGLTPDFASDEAIAEQEALDEDLTSTKAGAAGKFTGEVLATLPAAGAGGLAARAGARGTGALSKALATRAGQAGVEGGTAGLMLADPGERAQGALGGAAGGAFLSKALRGVADVASKGVTDLIPEAKRLKRLTRTVNRKTGGTVVEEGMFIPLSQSAKNKTVRMIYNTFLANVPFAGSVVRGQYDDAITRLRTFAGHEAIPDSPRVPGQYVITPKDSPEVILDKVKRYWSDEAFSGIKKETIVGLPQKLPVAEKWLADEILKRSKGTIAPIQRGQQMTGQEFLDLKRIVGSIIPKVEDPLKKVAIKYQKDLDELLKANLVGNKKPRIIKGRPVYSGGKADVYENYLEETRLWPTAKAFMEVASQRPNYSTQKLADAAHRITSVPAQKGPMQQATAASIKGLENFPSKQGAFVTLATTGALGAWFGGVSGAGLGVLAGIIAGRAGVSKGLQKFLSGQTRKQALTRIMRKKYRKELEALGMGARDVAIVLGSQDAS